MTTPTQLAPPLAVFFFFLLSSSAETTPLITQTCKQTPDYDLCITLLSARAAKATTVRALALATIQAIEAKATATSRYIKQLAKTAAHELKEPLQACDFYYGIIVDYDVPGARTEVRYGNPKFAVDPMVDSGAESGLCEKQFRGRGIKSPLTERNEDVRRLSAVATAIIRKLVV